MKRPKLLDLYCGAGGAARGYQLAGFDVTGVDHRKQSRYAGDRFIQADALELLHELISGATVSDSSGRPISMSTVDAIHASPPCHDHTPLVHRHRPDGTGRLLADTRSAFVATGLPYVIENVEGARRNMHNPALFCGGAFALGAMSYGDVWRPLRRHRLFESNVFLMSPGCGCSSREKLGVYGNGGGYANRGSPDRAGYRGNKAESAAAMGIDWMTIAELSQAIPPAYTRAIGEQLLAAMATT